MPTYSSLDLPLVLSLCSERSAPGLPYRGPVDRLSPKAQSIPFEQNIVFVQYCVNPAP